MSWCKYFVCAIPLVHSLMIFFQMNTLANHGYIPRNGIVSLAQTLVGAKQLFNMGITQRLACSHLYP